MQAAPQARREGFAGQRLCVLPRPRVAAALAAPATRRLVVTDAGWFPRASGHLRARPDGVPETIVIVCVAGRGTVRIGTETHAVSAGTCAIIPASAPHEYRASADDPWTIWWMHLRGTDVTDLVDPLPGLASPVRSLRGLDRVAALFDELVSTMERPPSDVRLVAASGVAWNLLARLAVDTVLPAEGTPLERAMRYLESRVEGSIQVTELAAMVGLSPSHLGALFREATGGGAAAYHASLRMARARSLLDTTPLTVAEVARAVGYADPLYFSRHFRRVHDVSPSGYRAQHKG
ncbi:helix-turn-helix domain-containing protein [Demequina rhizosphaerae]|uniref:helix-turn-helix domain-containing protein n=1 Tax=Demequina rhizosphaerae TaxID=1638985 RepID=UPI00078657A5|nr:helix-turn-helix domain-containing protein [Demequina rhizosphaerae]